MKSSPSNASSRLTAPTATLRTRRPWRSTCATSSSTSASRRPERRALTRDALAGFPEPTEAGLTVLAGSLWELPEREFQYAACDLVAKHVRVCGPGFIATARTLITSKSWWDTVDSLASDVVGDLVRRFPDLAATMDEWLESENLWVVRSAILHQLRFKEATDTDRLFAYCLRRADHKDFFIRKAIGWALRQYSWTDPEAVKRFVAEHEAELSPLSRREALLAITGHRKRQPASTDAPATPAARTGS